MPYRSLMLGRLVAFTLHGVDMQEFRTAHILQLIEHADEFLYVMSIHWTEVAYVESLKDILLLADERLDGIVEPYYRFLSAVIENAFADYMIRWW